MPKPDEAGLSRTIMTVAANRMFSRCKGSKNTPLTSATALQCICRKTNFTCCVAFLAATKRNSASRVPPLQPLSWRAYLAF
jgi:hypothetical protein